VASTRDNAGNIPAYGVGRTIFSGYRFNDDHFLYLVVDNECQAGYANSPRGTKHEANARIDIRIGERGKQLQAWLVVTSDIPQGIS
jgi:hypothetical protein